VYLNNLDSGAVVLAQLPHSIEDYNEVHPNKGLNMRSPREHLSALR
jgi:putative transposase